MTRLYAVLGPVVAWFEVAAHRRGLYQSLAAVGGGLVVAGLVTSDEVQKWLAVAASVLLAGGASLARAHTGNGKPAGGVGPAGSGDSPDGGGS